MRGFAIQNVSRTTSDGKLASPSQLLIVRGSTRKTVSRMQSDEELMSAVGKGDLAAFEQIVLRHQSAAWNSAYRFLGDAAEAEDVAQEAFLKILRAAPGYQPTATFRTYLYRVITRLCLDHAQKMKPVYTEKLPDAWDDATSLLQALTTEERDKEVRNALDSLPSNQRMAVILKYYEGLSYAEIASVIDTSIKAVERLLARARESLEKPLASLLE